jgi:hypothetical protein
MKRLRYSGLLLAILAVCLAGGCRESAPQEKAAGETYPVVKEFYKGPLRVQVGLSAEKINLSDLLRLRLTAEIEPKYDVKFPAMDDLLKDFKIRTDFPLTQKRSDNGKIMFEKRFEIEPLKAGACEIPALTVTFRQNEMSDELATEAVTVEAVSSLPPDTPPVIGDIEDVVEMPLSRWWLWAGLAAVPAALVAGIAFMRRPKKAVPVKRVYRAAHEIALEMLKCLAAEKLVEQGRITEYYQKLSGCLRHYIENRFALRAPEQTTEEFLSQLGDSDALRPDHKQQLRQFLEHCDLVKFARYQPTGEQINESMTIAERFINSTKSDSCAIDVTNDGPALKQEVS